MPPVDGATKPFVVMYIGSSTTEGTIGATDEHHNYVNHFSAMVVTHANNGVSTEKVIKQNSGSATRPTTNGIWFYNAGIGGRVASNYVDATVQSLASDLSPNLCIHMIGSNDYANQVTPASYQADIQSAINALNARGASGVQHILVHSYIRLDITAAQTYEWPAYKARLDALAAANSNVVSIDVSDLFANRGVFKGSNDPQNLVHDGDNIHATDAGYKFLAESMAVKLGMNLRRGEKIWELDPDALSLADGTAVDSLPSTAGTLEQTPATQTGANRPTLVHNSANGRKTLKFDGVDDSIAATFPKSYGLPLTMFAVVRTNSGGTSTRPIYSRVSTAHKGYIYAFDVETSAGNSNFTSISNSPTSKKSFAMRDDLYQVIAVVFRAADDQTVYISDKYGKSNETQAPDLTHGPFISSMRLGSNTGLNLFSPMNLAYARLYQGELTQAEIETQLDALGSRFNVPITYTPPVVYPEPATGPVTYQNDFSSNTTTSGQDLAGIGEGWVDQVNSTGQMHLYAGRLVPSGMGSYRTMSNYYRNAPLSSKYHYARAIIHAAPAASDPKAGVGLVVRHSGTQAIMCRLSTDGTWQVYAGTSLSGTNTVQTDPTYLGSGQIGDVVNGGDEMIVTVEKDDKVRIYLNNREITGGGVDVSSIAAGLNTGVLITMTNAGELRGFKTGVLTDQPAPVAYIEDTFVSVPATSTTANFVVPLPPNRQVGDLMILHGAVTNVTSPSTAPTGWSVVQRRTTTTSGAPRPAIYSRICDGTEASTVALNFGTKANTAAASAGILLFRNTPRTGQIINISANGGGTATTAHATPAITTTASAEVGRSMVVRMVFSSLAGAAPASAWTWPSPMTEMIERAADTNAINDADFGASWARPTAVGSQAAVTATHYASRTYGSLSFAINSIAIT